MPFYEENLAKLEEAATAWREARESSLRFLEAFGTGLARHLGWPGVETQLLTHEPAPKASCELRLCLKSTVAGLSIDLSMRLHAEPLPYANARHGLLKLMVEDFMSFHIVGPDHPQATEAWQEAYGHIEKWLAGRFEHHLQALTTSASAPLLQ